MFSKIGIISLVAGFLAWLLGAISGFMQSTNIFTEMTLSTLSEGLAESVVNAFSSETVSDFLYMLFYEVHLGGVFCGLGIIFIIISLFTKEY